MYSIPRTHASRLTACETQVCSCHRLYVVTGRPSVRCATERAGMRVGCAEPCTHRNHERCVLHESKGDPARCFTGRTEWDTRFITYQIPRITDCLCKYVRSVSLLQVKTLKHQATHDPVIDKHGDQSPTLVRRQYTKVTMNSPIVTRSARSIAFVRANMSWPPRLHFDCASRMSSSTPKLEPKSSLGALGSVFEVSMGVQRVLKEGKILKVLIRVPHP